MIAFLILVLHIVVAPLKTKARLEAEVILLRHQLMWWNGPAACGI
jgi:hypothetical protein